MFPDALQEAVTEGGAGMAVVGGMADPEHPLVQLTDIPWYAEYGYVVAPFWVLPIYAD